MVITYRLNWSKLCEGLLIHVGDRRKCRILNSNAQYTIPHRDEGKRLATYCTLIEGLCIYIYSQ